MRTPRQGSAAAASRAAVAAATAGGSGSSKPQPSRREAADQPETSSASGRNSGRHERQGQVEPTTAIRSPSPRMRAPELTIEEQAQGGRGIPHRTARRIWPRWHRDDVGGRRGHPGVCGRRSDRGPRRNTGLGNGRGARGLPHRVAETEPPCRPAEDRYRRLRRTATSGVARSTPAGSPIKSPRRAARSCSSR